MVLGGTIQKGNYSKEINAADKEHIIRETMLLEPSLKVSILNFEILRMLKARLERS